MACDVRVRDYIREGGAVVRVTKIEVDDARLQLNIQHEYGEAPGGCGVGCRGLVSIITHALLT
jgi:hypothetical protein